MESSGLEFANSGLRTRDCTVCLFDSFAAVPNVVPPPQIPIKEKKRSDDTVGNTPTQLHLQKVSVVRRGTLLGARNHDASHTNS